MEKPKIGANTGKQSLNKPVWQILKGHKIARRAQAERKFEVEVFPEEEHSLDGAHN